MSIHLLKELYPILFRTEKQHDINDDLIIAGNATSRISELDIEYNLTSQQEETVMGLRRMKICGNSMAPCGIENGDVVFVETIKDSIGKIRKDDFLILKIDKNIYNEPIRFNHKLRRYLMTFSRNESKSSIYTKLGRFHKHILYADYKERLNKKIDKTLDLYPSEKFFCLSITFKNGSLRYSIHPQNLVEGKVKFVLKLRKDFCLQEADKIESY